MGRMVCETHDRHGRPLVGASGIDDEWGHGMDQRASLVLAGFMAMDVHGGCGQLLPTFPNDAEYWPIFR